MSNNETDRGLHDKYIVKRIDGKKRGPYFVLDIYHDPNAEEALYAYADACEAKYPQLAWELRVSAVHRPDWGNVPASLKAECHDHVGCTGCGWLSYECECTDRTTNALAEHAKHVQEILNPAKGES